VERFPETTSGGFFAGQRASVATRQRTLVMDPLTPGLNGRCWRMQGSTEINQRPWTFLTKEDLRS
jgi:hypothetical protein